jgi:hypothetical protein
MIRQIAALLPRQIVGGASLVLRSPLASSI